MKYKSDRLGNALKKSYPMPKQQATYASRYKSSELTHGTTKDAKSSKKK